MGAAGAQPPDAQGQTGFVVVEVGQQMGLRHVFGAGFQVAPHRRPVAHRVGEQRQPLLQPVGVEQPCLVIQQIFELVAEFAESVPVRIHGRGFFRMGDDVRDDPAPVSTSSTG